MQKPSSRHFWLHWIANLTNDRYIFKDFFAFSFPEEKKQTVHLDSVENPASLALLWFLQLSDCLCLFRCSVCSDNLTNWYFEKDGKLYCQKHYWEKFGELCHGCSLLMTGPAMVSPLLFYIFYSLSRDTSLLSQTILRRCFSTNCLFIIKFVSSFIFILGELESSLRIYQWEHLTVTTELRNTGLRFF